MESSTFEDNDRANAIDLAYCRAALYSALAIGFQFPAQDSLDRLLTDESKASLSSAASLLYPSGGSNLVSLIEGFPVAAADIAAALSARHRQLFGHTARGPVPPYETEYGNEALFQQPQELGDLMGFYHAFGLTLKDNVKERPDHISCECEFLMFLALKEAYALEKGEREIVTETRKAEKLFLRDHLARFLPTFAAKLQREDPACFYGMLAQFCLLLISAECARLNINCGPANLGLRPADNSRVPMACGSGAECAPMPGACMPEESDSL
ncbi:MAG TPA: molecular chaperone TorD family protein [Burkholderiales bacterium]|nr:molecular chaperone TorD family protein [Burkholderiales bacterium]